ncbi:MAG: 3-deoxy-manno-octulosonate cytidylyltransferase [Acidobacteria bacterium]|nr:3-deoxy-manno-octulosonate cytidylyltransferase [Acidobacteriota bacterium]
MNVMAVIPARYGATRFPGKPLHLLSGKPMVQHVWERVRQAKSVSRVVVATDDERILRAVMEFGGEAAATRPDHRSGTERMAEVAASPAGEGTEIFVNVQGDEPLIYPEAIDAAVEAMIADSSIQVATLCVPLAYPTDIVNPNVVKVVLDFQGDALYFSRAPIPWVRDENADIRAQHMKHLGLYGFRREALLEFPTLPPGAHERLEQLEQLRLLENGYKIRVVETEFDSVSVDTPEDAARVEQLMQTTDSNSPENP